ncbi:hypothetical protein HZS_6333 [Henneguya salminicola]|nr:hypothetical protein HZS_6333 [Henneguya salminicola]
MMFIQIVVVNYLINKIFCWPEPNELYKNPEFNVLESRSQLIVYYSYRLQNGGFIPIQWMGIKNPTSRDQIGIYCPPSLNNSYYLRRYTQKEYPAIGQSNGYINVRVFYTRCACHFRYLQPNAFKDYDSVAISNEFSFAHSLSYPTHIHIALTDTPTSMRITWITGSNSKPCVKYGVLKNKLDVIECGNTTTYGSKDMCEPPATTYGFIEPGYIHSVVINRLEENTKYYYSVGNIYETSKIYSFNCPKTSDQNQQNSVILDVFGDLDVTPYPAAYGTISRIRQEIDSTLPPDLILHVGDISYAMGLAYIWEEFGLMIQPVASRVPYMMTIGNHEHNHVEGHENDPSKDGDNFRPVPSTYERDSGGECSVPMFYRYLMPNNGNSVFWYSYNYGMAHIISISSENNFTENSRQYKWLEKDLEGVNRKTTPWVIVVIHRPMYISTPNKFYDPASNVVFILEPLLIKYKVDFFMAGHYHCYERTCALNNNTCIEGKLTPENWGVVHLTVGTGGRELNTPQTSYRHWTKSSTIQYGYGRLEIFDQSHSKWKFKTNKYNEIFDEHDYYIDHNFSQ